MDAQSHNCSNARERARGQEYQVEGGGMLAELVMRTILPYYSQKELVYMSE